MKTKSSEVEIRVAEEGNKESRNMLCSKKTIITISNVFKRAFKSEDGTKTVYIISVTQLIKMIPAKLCSQHRTPLGEKLPTCEERVH